MPIPCISPDIRWFNSPYSTIVLHVPSGKYGWLNESATAVWIALAEGATRTEVEAALQNRFGISPEDAHTDAGQIIQMLLDKQWLSTAPSNPF